ncbi:hypothetical protein F4604DRAFT_1946057 [Suillus subluteus]|nr:hypothetical protein F4604DRAFT_1946057 [Suillus subluteus]
MSPMKNTKNYIASTTAELYRHPSTNQPAPILTSSSSSFQLSTAELYRRPSTQPAPISTSSSSSLQSSTFDYPNVPVASSSSSSGTSWNPHKDDYGPVAAKSLPFQYYPPQYSSSSEHRPADATSSPALSHYPPSEPQSHQPYWNPNSSGGSGAAQPDDFQEQLITNDPPMFSSHGFNIDSDQYFMGNSSSGWGGGAPGTGWGGPA